MPSHIWLQSDSHYGRYDCAHLIKKDFTILKKQIITDIVNDNMYVSNLY